MSEHSELAGDPALAVWLGRRQEASFNRAGPAVRNAYPPERRMTGPQLAEYLTRLNYALASSTRPDGRAHAAPTLFTSYAEAFWLPTLGDALRLDNVRANPWLALSIIKGEHDTHAAMLTEGPAEVLTAVPAGRPEHHRTAQRPPRAWTGQRPGCGSPHGGCSASPSTPGRTCPVSD